MTDCVTMTPEGPNGQLEPTTFVNPDTVLTGSSDEKDAMFFERDDGVAAGMWQCGNFDERIDHYPFDEMCTVIKGEVTISSSDGDANTYSAGDSFIMRKGFKGTWSTKGPFAKYFFITP